MASWKFVELSNISNACRVIFTINVSEIKYKDYADYKSSEHNFPQSGDNWAIGFTSASHDDDKLDNTKKGSIFLHIMSRNLEDGEWYKYKILSRLHSRPDFGYISSEVKTDNKIHSVQWAAEFFNLSQLRRSADVRGEIKIYFDVTIKRGFEFTKVDEAVPETSLNLYNFFVDEEYSDIALKAGDRVFKAHKIVLASASPVFDRMFKNETPEVTDEGSVDFESDKEELVEEMLHYMYTSKVTNNISNISFELFKLAHKYDIKGLQSICINYMLMGITARNVIDVLRLAEKYAIDDLRQGVMEFVKTNEEHLVKQADFINYLIEQLSSNNVADNLLLAYKYNLANFKLSLMKYVAENFRKVICEPEYRYLYVTNIDLILDVDEYLSRHLHA